MLIPPRVTIVIVTWNGQALLERCLPSVVAYSGDAEILVVDNGSTDDSVAWLKTRFPQVQVLALSENRGFCGGNNAGAEVARGEVLLFLNNDVEVTPGWLDPLLAHFNAHPDCAAVQPKLLRHDVRTQFEYAGAAGGFLDALGYPFARGRLFDTLEDDHGQYDAPRRIFWATGAALAVRRSALDGQPPFDEAYFMHMEEIDLCWRLQKAGHTVWCVPQSQVHHIGGASLAQGHPRKTYFNFRNNLLLLYRHLPPARWRHVFARRVALDMAAAARALARGQTAECRAILRAYRDAHRLKHGFAPTRASDPGPFPPYQGSVVQAYFLRGVRHFSALSASRFAPAFRDDQTGTRSAAPMARSVTPMPTSATGPGRSPKSA